MDDVKHTPGPWLMEKTGSAAIVYTLRETRWNGIPILENAWQAQFSQDGGYKTPIEEVFANARVAVAAPDMLAEMQRMLPVLEAIERQAILWGDVTEGTGSATLNAYRAAIAKATGGV